MKRLWIGRYGISFRFSWRCSYIGFSWNEGTLWIMPLPFCALSVEFPQRIKFTHGGYTSGKMLRAKLEMGNDDGYFGMKESDFEFVVKPGDVSDEDLESMKKAFEQPSKVVLVPKKDLLRVENTSICGPIDQYLIDEAAKRGQILHGWTGEKCPHCNGCGEVDSGGTDPGGNWINTKCAACGGTGDEYGELKAK